MKRELEIKQFVAQDFSFALPTIRRLNLRYRYLFIHISNEIDLYMQNIGIEQHFLKAE